jgi:hypothetical protein
MTTLAEFETMLKGHDWYFHYSDDPKYYRRGREQSEAISRAIKDLKAQGLTEEARELYNEISPSDFTFR